MSARMAAATGDSQWEERYRQFEPQLDAAIKDATRIGTGPSTLEAAAKIDAANVKLVEMENRAFALVRAGRKEEAQVVLFSPEYERQKTLYVEGITSFGDQIRRNLDESLREEKRVDLLLIIGALGVGGTSLVAWWSAARGVRRWHAQMLDSFHRRAEAEENLRKAHVELEVRVKERTAELADANEALQAENTERKRTEEALRASQQIIEGIINAIPARVFWKDKNLVYLGCNAAFAHDAGFADPKDIIGKDDYQMGWRDRAELYRSDDRQVIESGCSKLLIEEPQTTPEGNALTILTSKMPLRDSKGEISGVLGTYLDITERKQAEMALSRLAAIVESSGDAIIGKDLNGIITSWNKGAEEIFGYEASEMMGASIMRLIPTDRQEEEDRIKEKVRRGENVESFETLRQTKDGRLIDVSITASPIKDVNGKVIGVSKVARDITERKQAEGALRVSEAHLQTVVENLNEGVVVSDLNGKLLHWNRAALELHGFANVDDGARKLTELVDTFELSAIDGTPISVEEWPLSRILRGESLHDLELRVRNIKVGWQRIFSYGGTLVHDANNQPLLAIGTISDITERKQAEELMQASEERYRALFESNPSPMWVYDLETLSFLAVNAAAVKHYGYSQGEFRAMTIKDIRPSEDIPALMDDLSQKDDDLNQSSQWRHCTKDRKLIDVEITSNELTWLGRRAKVVLINDITERKRAEETLREQAALFDQTYDAVLVWDWKGPIRFWNRGAGSLYGYTDEEAVGKTSQQLLNTQVTGGLQTLIESLDRNGVWQGELKHTTSDGRQITVESRMALVREPKREYVLEINRDITERKRGEERLLEQADIINRAHDAIIIRNFEDRRVVFWNNGAERLYGWTAAEVMGEAGDANFADPEEIEKIMSALLSADEFRGEIKQITKEGKELITEERATLVRNPDGTPHSVLIICTDVTEQKKLETHLLRAQRLESIGTLASGVAHDLNNILTPILICAEILRENPTGEEAASSIALIEESAKRGANVVKQVLTFARGIEGESVPIKPSHLVQEMIDIAQNTFPKTIEILGCYTDDLWSIKCDPTQLHQVLLNLSVNARDAMPNGGSLKIGAENFDVDEHYASMTLGAKPGPHVMFRVTDTGTGMSRATIDKIFDPFFTTKEVGKGTGLGLSTALGIIKSHGGFISVYSEIGTGTTFKVFLPAQVSEAFSPKSAASLESLNGKGELILVVDDEAGIRRITKVILEKHNYRVLLANDGTEALAAFAQQTGSINAVLTDIMMPYVDGVALIRAIKKMKPEMVFIASTGQGEETRVAELESLGVKNFLTKPYDTAKLLETLRDTLSAQSHI